MASLPDDAQSTSTTMVRDRLERAFDLPVVQWVTPDTGLSAALRGSVTLGDGTSVFVKAATDEETEHWLRNEYLALQHVPARFIPGVVAWLDEPGSHPILVVDDLRRAHWPASHEGVDWREGDIDRVLAAVADLSRVEAPDVFFLAARGPALWPALVHEGPGRDSFLHLGLCSPTWLSHAAALLVEAEGSLDESGDRLIHGDLRSDNTCVEADRVIFVDWSHASRGHADQNLALLLPALHLEGGPLPYEAMPAGGGWAAAQCASLIRRIFDQPTLPTWLAKVLIRLTAIDLAWAASSLGLPRPDGIDWHTI